MSTYLNELLNENKFLFGVICRDISSTDIELLAQEGYKIVWFDIEHGSQSVEEVISLGRLTTHLGMISLARIPELNRTYVQRLLDGGIHIVNLPDVRSPAQTYEFERLGKFPPVGERGVSSTSAGTGFSLGPNPKETFLLANQRSNLMVMIESDEGYECLDEILEVDGVDIIAVGHQDWAVSLGLFDKDGKKEISTKAEQVLRKSHDAGKIISSSVSGPEDATYLADLGVRIMFTGVDVNLKRGAFADAISGPLKVLGH